MAKKPPTETQILAAGIVNILECQRGGSIDNKVLQQLKHLSRDIPVDPPIMYSEKFKDTITALEITNPSKELVKIIKSCERGKSDWTKAYKALDKEAKNNSELKKFLKAFKKEFDDFGITLDGTQVILEPGG